MTWAAIPWALLALYLVPPLVVLLHHRAGAEWMRLVFALSWPIWLWLSRREKRRK